MVVERRPSVRASVTLVASAVLAVALVVAALATAALLGRTLSSDVESQLDDRLDEVEALIHAGLLSTVLAPTGEAIGQVQVIDSAGRVVAVTPGLAAAVRLDVIPAPAVGTQTSATVDGSLIDGTANEDYRLVARTVTSAVGPVTMYAVSSLETAARAQRTLRNALLVGVPLLVLLSAAMTAWLVRRAFAPVDAMRIEVDRIEATDLSGRVVAASSDDEIARLGATLNRLLERLDEASRRQQVFAASASHELRSPLSAIRTELEVGLAYPDRAQWETIAADAMVEVGRLEVLARDLRLFTRANTAGPTRLTRFDLGTLVVDEVGRRQPPRTVQYEVDSGRTPHSVVWADPDDVIRVVRNLFDNAERHARSRIVVTLSTGTDAVTLLVENDGDPIPADHVEAVFEPFTRLDEARSLDAGGSGLGLAIARSIMVSIRGTLRAEVRSDGACFIASFPHPPS